MKILRPVEWFEIDRSGWRRTIKIKKHLRAIRLGRFLRKTSIDELPQSWKILKSDVSLTRSTTSAVGRI